MTFCVPAWSQGLQAPVSQSRINEPVDSGPQKVIVNAAQTDLEASRDFAAGKLIIGRKRIAESGLQNAAELLKREPSVTVGKDGQISLLGLPGYTQILLNGQKPDGRSPLEIDLSDIERIEIMKSSTAQTGPFGIAGTINLITRKLERKRFQQFSAGAQKATGAYGVNAAWSLNEASMESPWQWRVSVTADRRHNESPISFVQNETDSTQKSLVRFRGTGQLIDALEAVSLVSGIIYRINAENTISFDPAVNYLRSDDQNQAQRQYVNGQRWDITNDSMTELEMTSVPIAWTRQIGEGGQLKVDAKLSRNKVLVKSSNRNLWSPPFQKLNRSLNEDDSRSDIYRLNIQYKQSLDGGHEVMSGLTWTKKEQSSSNHYWFNGQPDLSLAQFGDASYIDNAALRFFIQDEWRVNKTVALNVGLSGEDSVSHIKEGPFVSQPKYRVWSPSLHVSKKLPNDNQRQFRFSIARNFKAPDTNSLMLRPIVNTLAPCSSYLDCPRNSLDTTDSAGNSGLQAERALSLNFSYEHGLSDESQISFEAYTRLIEQKFGREISLEAVAWSNQLRYVNRPVNFGDARIVGASVDWSLALRDMWKVAPKIEIRGSVGRAHSVVSNLPSPYNRLDGQTPWRAKLGMTYDVAGIPLKVNVDANWLPGDWIRNNLVQKTYESRHASYSANVIWTASKTMKWSMSLNNLFAPTRSSIREYQSESDLIQRHTEKSSYTKFSVRLELKL